MTALHELGNAIGYLFIDDNAPSVGHLHIVDGVVALECYIVIELIELALKCCQKTNL